MPAVLMPVLLTASVQALQRSDRGEPQNLETNWIKSTAEIGLIQYSTAPVLSALSFHSVALSAVMTTTGISAVAGFFLSSEIASTAIKSGRCKSVRIRSGRSVNALVIPSIEVAACDVS